MFILSHSVESGSFNVGNAEYFRHISAASSLCSRFSSMVVLSLFVVVSGDVDGEAT
jgi:hypothetical protein